MHPTRSARSACGRRVVAIVTHLSPKESKNMARKFDPITLEILWRHLLSIRVASRELYRLTEEEVRVEEGQK